MKQQRKVIHVQLKEPYKGKNHYYFGSIAAIYDVLPKDVVGITKESLWNVLKDETYTGTKSTIRFGILHTKQSNRGFKKDKEV